MEKIWRYRGKCLPLQSVKIKSKKCRTINYLNSSRYGRSLREAAVFALWQVQIKQSPILVTEGRFFCYKQESRLSLYASLLTRVIPFAGKCVTIGTIGQPFFRIVRSGRREEKK